MRRCFSRIISEETYIDLLVELVPITRYMPAMTKIMPFVFISMIMRAFSSGCLFVESSHPVKFFCEACFLAQGEVNVSLWPEENINCYEL